MTFEQIQKELVQAMKDKNRVKKSVLADVKTTALNIAIEEKHKENVTEENVLTAMKKYQKACQQQIDTCPASRPDLMEAFQACMNCITEYLPKQLTEEDINDILIICDDLDTKVGTYRLRYKGSSGGHNGLKNIELHLSTKDYKRIK